jgi:hypothetical protein
VAASSNKGHVHGPQIPHLPQACPKYAAPSLAASYERMGHTHVSCANVQARVLN